MSTSLVLDASVAVAVLLNSEGALVCGEAMSRAGVRLAPGHLLLVVCSASTRLVRHGALKADALTGLLPKARALVDRFTPSSDLVDAAFTLSLRHGFVPYDAIYLALAQREACKVLTRDGRLVRGFAAAGLSSLIEAI